MQGIMERRKDPRVHLLWVRQCSGLFAPLSLNVLREICTWFPPSYRLALIYANSLRLFDFSAQQMGAAVQLEVPIQANEQSRWAAVDDVWWVLCGGMGEVYVDMVGGVDFRGWRTAYLLHKNGQVRALPDLNFGHGNCGLSVWHGAIHIFGSGDKAGSQVCERFTLSSAEKWQLLPSLRTARCAFTPTIWRHVIYLCGGTQSCSIEIFDGRSMRLLPLRLPEPGSVVSWAQGDCLQVLSRNYISTLVAQSGVSVPALCTKAHDSCQNYPYQSPVLYRDIVYCVSYAGTVYKYSPVQGDKVGYITR